MAKLKYKLRTAFSRALSKTEIASQILRHDEYTGALNRATGVQWERGFHGTLTYQARCRSAEHAATACDLMNARFATDKMFCHDSDDWSVVHVARQNISQNRGRLYDETLDGVREILQEGEARGQENLRINNLTDYKLIERGRFVEVARPDVLN